MHAKFNTQRKVAISFFIEMLTRGYVDVYNMDRLGFSEVNKTAN